MHTAIYKTENYTKFIKANEMTKYEYQQIYKGHLYCPTPNCNARLIHIEIEKINLSYFKTLQKNNHIDTCPNKFNRTYNKDRYSYTSNAEGLTFSESHIQNVFKNTLAKMQKKSKSLTPKENNDRNKTSPNTSESKPKKKNTDSYKYGGKTGDNTSKRQPHIFSKTITEFLNSKDRTYSLYGFLTKIDFINGHAYLTLSDASNSHIRLYLGNIFIQNSETEFKLLPIIKKYLEQSNEKIESIIVCHKTKHNEEIIGEVVEHKTMFLDRMHFYEFLEKAKLNLSIK